MGKFVNFGLVLVFLKSFGFSQAVLPDNTLYGCEEAQGFKSLYDGTIASFRNNFVDYIEGNTTNTSLSSIWSVDLATKAIYLPANSPNPPPDPRSKAIYSDMDLRLNYKCSGNEGVYYRFTTASFLPWMTGIEVAIHDGEPLGKYSDGAAYDLYAPPVNIYHSFKSTTNPWNELRIVVIGDSVEHWLNGIRIVKFKYFSKDYFTVYDGSKWHKTYNDQMSFAVKGDRGSGPIMAGYIGFQADHGGAWYIKNLRINTAPKWSTAYAWPPTCVPPTSISAKKTFSQPKAFLLNGKLNVSVPEVSILKAELVNLRGQVLFHGQIDDRGNAEFPAMHDGVYFLHYVSETGSHSVPLGLLSQH